MKKSLEKVFSWTFRVSCILVSIEYEGKEREQRPKFTPNSTESGEFIHKQRRMKRYMKKTWRQRRGAPSSLDIKNVGNARLFSCLTPNTSLIRKSWGKRNTCRSSRQTRPGAFFWALRKNYTASVHFKWVMQSCKSRTLFQVLPSALLGMFDIIEVSVVSCGMSLHVLQEERLVYRHRQSLFASLQFLMASLKLLQQPKRCWEERALSPSHNNNTYIFERCLRTRTTCMRVGNIYPYIKGSSYCRCKTEQEQNKNDENVFLWVHEEEDPGSKSANCLSRRGYFESSLTPLTRVVSTRSLPSLLSSLV